VPNIEVEMHVVDHGALRSKMMACGFSWGKNIIFHRKGPPSLKLRRAGSKVSAKGFVGFGTFF